MSLTDKLKSSAINGIKQMNILAFDSYAREHAFTLNNLYKQGVLDDVSLERALECVVIKQATWDYHTMMCLRGTDFPRYADHLGKKDCLAYALEQGHFSEDEINQIPFGPDQDKDSYIQKYGKENFLSELKYNLLNPRPVPLMKPSKHYFVDSSID